MEVVIYTQRVAVIDAYQERRDCADQRIADFIWECGFLPVPVPNRSSFAEAIVEKLHPSGIILTGGNSLVSHGGDAPERDSMDRILISLAVRQGLPLYGFCRGMQSILSYFGNELENIEGHVAVHHLIQEGTECYKVNSYHNQACRNLKNGCGLVVTARSEDGVIEAVQHEIFPVAGTMWHPEREDGFIKKDLERVRNLFDIDKQRRIST
jgi:putative glutamine amidotransferase